MGALSAIPGVSLAPSVEQVILPTNYLSLYDWTNQYYPDHYKDLIMTYGNQQITGLVRYHSNESFFESDVVYWAEEGRLHTNYNDVTRSGSTFTKEDHVFRLNDIIRVSDVGDVKEGIVTSVPDKDTFVLSAYESAAFSGLGVTDITAFKIGTEWRKGVTADRNSLDKVITVRSNSPITHRDQHTTSGSDITSVSWVQDPHSGGFYWFLLNEKDVFTRFDDHAEMICLLGKAAEVGSAANAAGYKGTEGLFDVVERRGNLYNGTIDTIPQWDEIVTRLDAQGKIRDYMIYCDRAQSTAIDDMLGELNAGYTSGGVSYGIFENSADMAVNLGFVGFRRSGYNIFKNDYKLFNDPTLLGSEDPAVKYRSIMIPYGTEEVYEAPNGSASASKHSKPFLELKYRGNQYENRRFKTWETGSAGVGMPTSTLDAREVNLLTERMLCVHGAENFIIGKGV